MSVDVVVRVRPSATADPPAVTIHDGNRVELASHGAKRAYAFDHAHGQTASQVEVFRSVRSVVAGVVDGVSGTILAYGQTGSGKTHTILGPSRDRGVIPRAAAAIFHHLNDKAEKLGASFSFTVDVVLVELHADRITDLLSSHTLPSHSLDGAARVRCHSAEELVRAVLSGWNRRRVAATAINSKSSRSHAILQIKVCTRVSTPSESQSTAALVHIVDLAGSERHCHSCTTGDGLAQAAHINKSLSALSRVVDALGKGASYVPFRDSKLTLLLRDSLGGTARTVILIHLHPDQRYSADSESTIQFAVRCKNVKNAVVANKEIRVDASALREEVARLRAQLDEASGQLACYSRRADHKQSHNNASSRRDLREKIDQLEFELAEARTDRDTLREQLHSLAASHTPPDPQQSHPPHQSTTQNIDDTLGDFLDDVYDDSKPTDITGATPLREEIARLEERVEQETQRTADMEKQLTQERERTADLEKQLKSRDVLVEDTERHLREIKAGHAREMETMRELDEDRQTEVRNTHSQLKRAKQELVEATQKGDKACNKRSEANKELKSARQELAAKDKIIRQLREKLGDSENTPPPSVYVTRSRTVGTRNN